MTRIHRVMDDGRRYYEDLLGGDDGVLVVPEVARFAGGKLAVGDAVVADDVPVLLAVGAAPSVTPIAGAAETPHLTSAELLHLDHLPASLGIVGGGPIALEFAQALNRLGVVVTIVMRAAAPLRGEEPEAGELVARVLRAEGVTVVTGATEIIIERSAPGGRLRWAGGQVDVERILLATGREPAMADLRPDAGGVELDQGGILVDATLRTTRSSTWAIGDAIGGAHRRFQFTHAATYEGPQAVNNALRGDAMTPTYHAMPRVTFTDPQVAAVGLTEAEARAAGHDVHVHVKLVRELGKARALGETEGFVKVVLDRSTHRLLGATIVAAHGGDMLASLTIPLNMGGDLGPVLATTFAHPTLSEALKVAVRNAVTSLG